MKKNTLCEDNVNWRHTKGTQIEGLWGKCKLRCLIRNPLLIWIISDKLFDWENILDPLKWRYMKKMPALLPLGPSTRPCAAAAARWLKTKMAQIIHNDNVGCVCKWLLLSVAWHACVDSPVLQFDCLVSYEGYKARRHKLMNQKILFVVKNTHIFCHYHYHKNPL